MLKFLLFLKQKQCLLNIINKDDACFPISVVTFLYLKKDKPELIEKEPKYIEVLNLKGIELPMTLNQIEKFQKLNNVLINAYSINDSYLITPIFLTKNLIENRHIILFYIFKTGGYPGHFCLFNVLSKLLSTQVNKHIGKKCFCDRCLHALHNEQKLQNHVERTM